jgi:hypothetical protein
MLGQGRNSFYGLFFHFVFNYSCDNLQSIVHERKIYTMEPSQSVYRIGRDTDCQIIGGAHDKPIQLWMHHFHVMVILINPSNGDICTQFFPEPNNKSTLDGSPRRQLMQDLFLDTSNNTVALVLNTNHNDKSHLNSYTSNLKERGVQILTLTADVKAFPEYKEYSFGEIPVCFEIDPRNPETIQILGPDEGDMQTPRSSIQQTILTEVGDRPSSVTHVNAVIEQYDRFNDLFPLIAWADKRLPVYLQNQGINFGDLLTLPERVTDALTRQMNISRKPFSENYLYDDCDDGISGIQDVYSRLNETQKQQFHAAITQLFPAQPLPDNCDSTTLRSFLTSVCGNDKEQIQSFISKMKDSLNREHPFHHYTMGYLTEDGSVDQIVDTLAFVRDHGMPAPVVGILASHAAEETTRRLSRTDDDDPAFPLLCAHAKKLMTFAVDLVGHQETELDQAACIESMWGAFGHLNGLLKHRVPDAPQIDFLESQGFLPPGAKTSLMSGDSRG